MGPQVRSRSFRGLISRTQADNRALLCASIVFSTEQENVDCSQSPVFSWDRLDIPRLTAKAILIFKCTEGAGVGDYSSQSPIFSWDRLDIPRLTITAILIFNCTKGADVGDYSPGGGAIFLASFQKKENDVSRTDEISFLQTFRVQIRLFLQDPRVYFWLYRGTVYYFIARRFICYWIVLHFVVFSYFVLL